MAGIFSLLHEIKKFKIVTTKFTSRNSKLTPPNDNY
jgi:hypothetical protein